MALSGRVLSVLALVVCLFIPGASGETMGGMETGLAVGIVGCVVVLVVVVAICIDKRVHTELLDRGPPNWTRSLQIRPEYNGGFSGTSDGIENLNPFHVTRKRLGMSVTDGARWDVGFTEGKHVFEVIWPAKRNRGTCSSIGVGSIQVPLKAQGRLSLVGSHSQSWGFDLSSRKVVNANKPVGSFPRQIKDRFFMYVDMDSGKIGFGEDVKQLGRSALFYGNIINNIRLDRSTPLHVMVGMCAPREEVQVYYHGTAIPQGGFDLCPPPGGPIVVTHHQQQPPAMFEGGGPIGAGPPPPESVPGQAVY